MKPGDKVVRRPVTLGHEDKAGRATGERMTGTVVYIHPKGRYHTVEFVLRGGVMRESFCGAR